MVYSFFKIKNYFLVVQYHHLLYIFTGSNFQPVQNVDSNSLLKNKNIKNFEISLGKL